jgi:hypothetical protein
MMEGTEADLPALEMDHEKEEEEDEGKEEEGSER